MLRAIPKRNLKRVALLHCAISLTSGANAQQPPSDSSAGLQIFLQNALDVTRGRDDQKLAALIQEMEIPDSDAWFVSIFGRAGSFYAETYRAKLSEQDLARRHMLQVTGRWMKGGNKVLIRKVNDAPQAGDAYETGLMKNLQRPVSIYLAYYKTSAPRPNPIGYFVFVDGEFRWLSSFVVEVVSSSFKVP